MEIYQDQTRSFEERAADLVSKMTLEEKVMQVSNNATPIPRLGIPAYNYWSEASHGYFGPMVRDQLDVTSYPVCLAMSQSWDREKIKKVTAAISDEIRAHHNANNIPLNMWCPTINLGRDPRNGRNDEAFGEDPTLTGKLAASYIQGMQGDDPKYIKVIATPKHYALNSSENNRHTGSSNVDEATLREYYTKVFQYAIREGKAKSIMTSYNRINGVPASVNDKLLTTLLREEWGFDGFVVSDCGAVADCYTNSMFSGATALSHYYCKSMEEASALSLIKGTDMSCGNEHKRGLLNALKQGMITEDVVDRALIRVLTTRFQLGVFDKQGSVPYDSIGPEHICGKAESALSVDIANDSIVLLKNEQNLLPLKKGELKNILVIGPNALYRQLGGYSAGQSANIDTLVNIMALEGIKGEAAGITINYEKGWCSAEEFRKGGIFDALPGFDPADSVFDLPMSIEEMGDKAKSGDYSIEDLFPGVHAKKRHVPEDPDYQGDSDKLFARALEAAKKADAVIVVAGTDTTISSEEHDRENLKLPYDQDEKIQKLLDAHKRTVVVLTTIGSVTGAFLDKAHTLVNATFAGQAQGTAIANILFGKVNPNAKLTATWYKNLEDLPIINDYGIKKQDTYEKKGRTYMYFDGPVQFPFGHGLSYTRYEYGRLAAAKAAYDANETLEVSLDITNAGSMDGAEIVQLYVAKVLPPKVRDNKPARQLKAWEKVWLKAGETKKITLRLPLRDIAFWSNFQNRMIVESGTYKIMAGPSSAVLPSETQIQVTGTWKAALSSVYALADKQVYAIGGQGKINVSATLEDTTHLCPGEYSLVFASSDEKTASVDGQGLVTAKAAGTTLITATVSYEGVTKSAIIPAAVK